MNSLFPPSRSPGTDEIVLYRYRLFLEDGAEAGEEENAVVVRLLPH
jgi:hypothetical protein